MAEGRVDKISFVVYDVADRQQAVVQERWVFDVGAWPVVARTDRFVEFEEPVVGKGKGVEKPPVNNEEGEGMKTAGEEVKIHIVDIEEQLRATIRRLAYTAEKMPPLPEGCTYTVIVELRDDATPPIGVSRGPFLYLTTLLTHQSPASPALGPLTAFTPENSRQRNRHHYRGPSTPRPTRNANPLRRLRGFRARDVG